MTKNVALLIALLLVQVLQNNLVVQAQQNVSVCSEAGNVTCSLTNETCVSMDNIESCRSCLVGFVRFDNETETCISISDLNLEKFKLVFDPLFVEPTISLEQRFEFLTKTAESISQHNAQFPPSSYELRLNKFSADSFGERMRRNGFRHVAGSEARLESFSTSSTTELPSRINWVERRAVTSVKDQGACGCCWAVSTVGALEGQAAINSNFTYLESLSFQQLISCDDDSFGCDGGYLVGAIFYATGGLASWIDYPFSDRTGDTTETCTLTDKSPSVDSDDGQVVLSTDDNDSFDDRVQKLKQAVAQMPVAITFAANCNTMYSYHKGVVTDDGNCACESTSCIDHAVLVVGYDDTDELPYWLIKNSWSTAWGEEGYMRVAQQSGGKWGLFAMLGQAVVPKNAMETTAGDTFEEPKDPPNNLETWEIVLISLGCALGVGLICCAICMFCKKK